MSAHFAESAAFPDDWRSWFDAGWHGTSAVDWATRWLPARLSRELALLDQLVTEYPVFQRAVQRERRNAVDRLIRFQYHLPWSCKNATPFAQESHIPAGAKTEIEHAVPVSQLCSLVLMALGRVCKPRMFRTCDPI